MADEKIVFGRRAAGRISRAVHRVERLPAQLVPDARGRPRGGLSLFLALVISSAADNNNPTTRWKYKVHRIRGKSAAGYGAEVFLTDDADITAYNAAECVNTTTGRQGNGIDVAHLDIDGDLTRDFEFYAIQNNTPVLCMMVQYSGHAAEAWIVGAGLPNGVDGVCPV